MDARLWHQQATTPPRPLPTPISVETFDTMTEAAQDAYWQELTTALAGLVLPSPLAQRAGAMIRICGWSSAG